MSALKKGYHIKKSDFIHAGEASIHVKKLLKTLNYNPKLIRRIAICGYEAEMNVVMHGGDGRLSIEINSDQLVLKVSDNGLGIADVELAMQAGFSTASDEHREMGFGAGMGLPNMKKNADRLDLASESGKGTQVVMIFQTGLET